MSTANAQVLRKAAEDLEVNGWIQGQLFQGKASCAVGAIYRVLGVVDEPDGTLVGLNREVAERAMELDTILARHLDVSATAYWNDAPGRTETDVVKELLTVADLEDIS